MASELLAIEDNHAFALKPIRQNLAPNGEPIEPIEAVENAGEFPTLTDQGEGCIRSRDLTSPWGSSQ
jgi:hypothetical protein